ncbi:MAG: DUF1273 family protein [Clostridia bacterium]|nr:DUF1273 family protein [Clostridia bacterium]
MEKETSVCKACCFTGHRYIAQKDYVKIKENLRVVIRSFIENGTTCFLAGGALGFDTMAAQAVLELKREFPHIRLELVLPCKNQSAPWTALQKAVYAEIIEQSDSVTYTSDEYYAGCMQKRNRALVDNSDACICCLWKDGGGTAYTVRYAKQQGKTVINVAKMEG